ncbi:uncharacterized protein N7515_005482 [Penicillium bovifimosum]|uniref:Uncharacterized protein n=1 Tax=Penicillium bovifimosum TaxID=126998 RepID=A0A9W9GT83_9EURO|nr:uncharacterized protein N7515_005482 [Penicillium bovifimosum]KAJ5129443.1 hypothetical protein N7515_005482 [Penicillium bovifimosum]
MVDDHRNVDDVSGYVRYAGIEEDVLVKKEGGRVFLYGMQVFMQAIDDALEPGGHGVYPVGP